MKFPLADDSLESRRTRKGKRCRREALSSAGRSVRAVSASMTSASSANATTPNPATGNPANPATIWAQTNGVAGRPSRSDQPKSANTGAETRKTITNVMNLPATFANQLKKKKPSKLTPMNGSMSQVTTSFDMPRWASTQRGTSISKRFSPNQKKDVEINNGKKSRLVDTSQIQRKTSVREPLEC